MAKGTLTDLQLSVMKALWELGEGTVGEVLAVLARDGNTVGLQAIGVPTAGARLRRVR
jgi:predicted transcriptional regulator